MSAKVLKLMNLLVEDCSCKGAEYRMTSGGEPYCSWCNDSQLQPTEQGKRLMEYLEAVYGLERK